MSQQQISNEPTTDVDKASKALAEALAKNYEASEAIERNGKKIVIPAYMSYRQAAKSILDHEKQMEEVQQNRVEIQCHPHDGLVNFYRAMKETFGTMVGTHVDTLFGRIPGRTMAIPVDWDETVNVPVGKVQIPGLPVEITTSVEDDDHLVLYFEYKRKYDPLVKEIERLTREKVATQSIFKGKAIDQDFNFLNVRTLDESKIVYNEVEAHQIEASILTPIRRREQCLAAGIQIKRGVLLEGPYGTGKTLTALRSAKECVQNGWTFINVQDPAKFTEALDFAKRYQPCVVFVEDIDAATAGSGRSNEINSILNTMDGLLSKDAQVMVVVTTNHVERINRAMLRPGRLDAVIHLGELEGEAVVRFVRTQAVNEHNESLLQGDLDEEAITEAGNGYVPAFLAEGIKRAKMHAIASGNEGITSDDLVNAFKGLRQQWALMREDAVNDTPTLDATFNDLVRVRASEEATKAVRDNVRPDLLVPLSDN